MLLTFKLTFSNLVCTSSLRESEQVEERDKQIKNKINKYINIINGLCFTIRPYNVLLCTVYFSSILRLMLFLLMSVFAPVVFLSLVTLVTKKSERPKGLLSAGRCALISCSHAMCSLPLLSVMTRGVVYHSQRTHTQTHTHHHSHMSSWIGAMFVSSVIYTTVCSHNGSLSAQVKLKHLTSHERLGRRWPTQMVLQVSASNLLSFFKSIAFKFLENNFRHSPDSQ